jgi:hypothetical protein
MEASQHSLLAACFTLHSINATLAIVPQRGAGLWITFHYNYLISPHILLLHTNLLLYKQIAWCISKCTWPKIIHPPKRENLTVIWHGDIRYRNTLRPNGVYIYLHLHILNQIRKSMQHYYAEELEIFRRTVLVWNDSSEHVSTASSEGSFVSHSLSKCP